jgi:phage gpG-like protein
MANIQEILRAANIAMTAREFLRLDRETQQDILINIAEQQEI